MFFYLKDYFHTKKTTELEYGHLMLSAPCHYAAQTQTQKGKKVKADTALHGNPISELRDVTCHMGSHSVTCHPTQVNAPRLTPAMQAGTRFTYPGGMEG